MLNTLAAAIGIGVVLGVVAYTITTPDRGTASSDASAWRALLPTPVGVREAGPSGPRIIGHPAPADTSTSATFRFTEPPSSSRFACRLDDGGWAACRSPVVLTGLSPGPHDFLVRGEGLSGRAVASALFPWAVVESQPFSIYPQLSGLSDLYPGNPPVVLPLKLVNPNSVPIAVTSLQVSVSRDPPGCPSAENLELIPSNASSSKPLRLRAGGSAWVPARGILAPAIRLRERPVNQDACEHARFPLVFSGTAHG